MCVNVEPVYHCVGVQTGLELTPGAIPFTGVIPFIARHGLTYSNTETLSQERETKRWRRVINPVNPGITSILLAGSTFSSYAKHMPKVKEEE